MKNSTINSRTLWCKCLIGLLLAVFFFSDFQKLHAQCPVATSTPSSQVICDCSIAAIALSSDIPGTAFSWNVIQIGVTGATSGSGSTIAQTLCTSGSVAGTAIYTITPEANGCVGSSINDTVTVNTIPLADFSYSDTSYCQNASNNPSAIFGSGASAGTFSSYPAGLVFVSINTGELDLATSAIGTYTVTNTIISNGGCATVSSSTIVTITLMDDPSFVYSSGTYCISGTNPTPVITGLPGGEFSASPSGLAIDSLTGTINIATSALGTYTVSYATNGSCNNISAVNITITNGSPSANFNYSDSIFCKNVGNPSPIFGSGAVAGIFSAVPTGLVFVNNNTGKINLIASVTGTYTVTNTIPASGGCAAGSATCLVIIIPGDNASFTYPSGTYCTSGTNPSPTITGLPGGTFSSIPAGLTINPSTGIINLSLSATGTYSVTYTTNGNCPNTNSITITITVAPSANFSYFGSPFCQYSNNPLPAFGFGASAGIFSATPSGLVFVNVNTGQIDVVLSAPGIYTVTNSIPASGGCAGVSATTAIQINSCGIITGSVYKDNNANCLMDSGDHGMYFIPVKLYDYNNNFIGIRYPNWSGNYQFLAPLGTYSVKIDTTNIPFAVQCLYPGIDTVIALTGGNPAASSVNFGIACKPGFDIGVKAISSTGLVFPGVQHKLGIAAGSMIQWSWYGYNFNCPAPISGQVQIAVTGPVTYNGIVYGSLTPLVSGNVFTYSIADFDQINNYQDFILNFITDTSAQLGDQICVNVIVTPTSGDNNPSNNTYNFCYVVGNSYDPNMKEVYPVNVAPAYQDWFTYTIHFQNTGNASAMNIRLADTLDANLDFETFEVINYSDSIEVSLDNNLLNFHFPNIMLPDSTSDPEGSKGYVQYRVKP